MLNQIKSMQKLPNSVRNLFRFSLLCFYVLFNKTIRMLLFPTSSIVCGQCDIMCSSTMCVYLLFFGNVNFLFDARHFVEMPMNRSHFSDLRICQSFRFAPLQLCTLICECTFYAIQPDQTFEKSTLIKFETKRTHPSSVQRQFGIISLAPHKSSCLLTIV